LALPMADVERGACFDGLQQEGVNRNQGAESTLAYLWTELHRGEAEQTARDFANTAIAHA
jgi:hypothetical protein